MTYFFAYLINFVILAVVTVVVVGLIAFLVVRAVRKKRAAGNG